MIAVVNGTDGAIALGKTTLAPGTISHAVPSRTTTVVVHGKKVALKDAEKFMAKNHTSHMTSKDGVGVFEVRTADGTHALYVTESTHNGQALGTFVSPAGVLYFNKTAGGPIPSGFLPFGTPGSAYPGSMYSGSMNPHGGSNMAPIIPGKMPMPAPHIPDAVIDAFGPTVACDRPLELAGMDRLMSDIRLAQAQGDYPPVRLVPQDKSLPTRIEFAPALVTARAPGIASSKACGMTPAEAIAAHGETLVAAPLRPQDVMTTYASEGPRYRGGFVTHPRGGVPLGFGQATLNLTPQSDWALCRKENVKRINYMMDRLADLQIAAMNSGSPL